MRVFGIGGVKMYAIIESGGKQYRVKQGDILNVELLNAEANTLHWRKRAMQNMIKPLILACFLNHNTVAGLLHHTNSGGVALFILTNRAGFLIS